MRHACSTPTVPIAATGTPSLVLTYCRAWALETSSQECASFVLGSEVNTLTLYVQSTNLPGHASPQSPSGTHAISSFICSGKFSNMGITSSILRQRGFPHLPPFFIPTVLCLPTHPSNPQKEGEWGVSPLLLAFPEGPCGPSYPLYISELPEPPSFVDVIMLLLSCC